MRNRFVASLELSLIRSACFAGADQMRLSMDDWARLEWS
tara:strand:+ start:385 stop:501 length:117 start_codon:yes stop_codon:yes gene_type:complete